ncbi:ABC transporter ATP-binding protein [Verminephrobacter eiseniae]|uniref:ABC transporter ATP-binding protein n=1 Tax=Verminephrobacter eiseniae TaxID=364317 RepID=UPI002238AEC5|nr:ABC transporter ATP-binding protein [Verminephrobacter eiseniae]MCW5238514.1 ABC transporter ATP-binding protein [Verminephrobacter eiseniae]
MSALRLSGITKRYGSQTVVNGLDLAVGAGEFVSLLGPSGCGKTTLLRIIAGLTACDSGRIVLADSDVTALPAHQRNIGVVFQSYALFAHLSVGENIAFGLKARGASKAEIAKGVAAALKSVQLSALADRPISALSGGQQQRVAVARAIATRPRLILLDEPLSALDRKLREAMQIELRQMLRDAGMTAIFVTHDQQEALVMSDRIAVMNGGCIEQFDVPERIYARPRTPFALNFVGLSSQWTGQVSRIEGDTLTVRTACGDITAPAMPGLRPGTKVLVGVRPERMTARPEAAALHGASDNRLTLPVSEIVYRGANRLVYFGAPECAPGSLMAELPAHLGAAPAHGDLLLLSWPVADTLVFALGAQVPAP